MTWEDIQGWFDYAEVWDRIVANYPGGTIVEVGTYLGRSLCYLGQLAQRSGKPFRVVGVDWCLGSGEEVMAGDHRGDFHRDAVNRGGRSFVGELWNNVIACGLHDVVSLLVGESGRVSNLFADGSLTAVFIDARHDYLSVSRDIELWLPKVCPRGLIGGDDYSPVWPGVEHAVDEIFGKDRISVVGPDAWMVTLP